MLYRWPKQPFFVSLITSWEHYCMLRLFVMLYYLIGTARDFLPNLLNTADKLIAIRRTSEPAHSSNILDAGHRRHSIFYHLCIDYVSVAVKSFCPFEATDYNHISFFIHFSHVSSTKEIDQPPRMPCIMSTLQHSRTAKSYYKLSVFDKNYFRSSYCGVADSNAIFHTCISFLSGLLFTIFVFLWTHLCLIVILLVLSWEPEVQ